MTEPSPAPQADCADLARRVLVELLRRHRLDASLEPGGDVRIGDEGLRVECAANEEKGAGGQLHVRLDLGLWLDKYPDVPIATPLSGYGPTPPLAVADGLADWMHRVLEPTRAALGCLERRPTGTMASVTDDGGGNRIEISWDVYAGEPVLVHAAPQPPPPIEEVTGDQILLGLVADPVLIARGLTSREIAERLVISLKTADLPFARGDLPAGYLIASAEDLGRYLLAHLNRGRIDGAAVLSPPGWTSCTGRASRPAAPTRTTRWARACSATGTSLSSATAARRTTSARSWGYCRSAASATQS
jgi:hypothetical protein